MNVTLHNSKFKLQTPITHYETIELFENMKGKQKFRGQFNSLSKSSSTSLHSYVVERSECYVPFEVEEPVFEFDVNDMGHEDDVFSIYNDELLNPTDPKLPEFHDPEDNMLRDPVSGMKSQSIIIFLVSASYHNIPNLEGTWEEVDKGK
jgi:hypothetical protein